MMSQQSFKRKWAFCLLLCWSIVTVYAQNDLARLHKFSIVDFHQDPQATTAMSKEYEKFDGSGSRYAIIKFMSADPSIQIDNMEAFMFDFGNMKHQSELHGDELWVYVQKNARTVSISREGYAPIKKWDLKTTIKEGATYVMKITFDKVTWNVERSLNKQFLQIKLEPGLSGALVTLTREGEREPMETSTTDATGSVAWNLEFGTYFYDIKAPNYTAKPGKVTLVSSDKTHVETVALIPKFGFLEIQDPGNAAGAKVFVNNKEVGTVPYKTDTKWDSGTYELVLVKELYKTYTGTFTINQGETTVITPQMESNFAETTLIAEEGADIYIDEVRKGTTRWAGPLKAGTYLVESRKKYHRPTSKYITVEADKAGTITLDPPTPITGFLTISSTPLGAEIKIDGVSRGKTPLNINDMLIGGHKVELLMPNRKTETREVFIEEGKQESLHVELKSTAPVTFKCNMKWAAVYINGVLESKQTPFTKEMASGTYDIEAKVSSNYRPFHKKMYIDVANPVVDIKLARQYMKKHSFYFGVDGQFGALTAFGGTMGFYAGNVNVETFCMKGFGKETVFWTLNGTPDENNYPNEEELKTGICAGGKVGYGFVIGTRFRMTPQVGCNYINVQGEQTKAYALTGTGGLRLELACSRFIGFSVTPEYTFKLKESDTYQLLSPILPNMKSWTSGFNCKVGVFMFF